MKINYKNILLNLEDAGKVDVDISHRGGYYTIRTETVIAEVLPSMSDRMERKIMECLPPKIGAGCNYLGGGLRGSIMTSGSAETFEKHGVPVKYAETLGVLCEAVKARYIEIENGAGLNDEEYPDGDTNWNAWGTNRARKAGVVSGY